MTSSKLAKQRIAYIHAVGRRKTASARVRLYLNPGEIMVNGMPISKYFPGQEDQARYLEPLRTTNVLEKVSATIKVEGGGKNGQLEAIVLGLSRALIKADPEHRPGLKKKGFLTRDERMRERRKVGMGGKARRKKQSPKR